MRIDREKKHGMFEYGLSIIMAFVSVLPTLLFAQEPAAKSLSGIVPSAQSCEFSRLQEPFKSLAAAYKRSEAFTLGEKVSPNSKNKATELIYRQKTKYWKGFDWKIRPLEIVAAMSAQDKYFELCLSQHKSLLPALLEDYQNEKIPLKDRKKYMRTLFLLLPCLEENSMKEVLKVSSEYFHKYTEEFVSLVITSESEAPLFAADYAACQNARLRENAITDRLLLGIERSLETTGIQKNLLIRLKNLRANKLHYKSGKYFFERIDTLLANVAEK
jgi:hypothetical protein